MYPQERQDEILRILEKHQYVSVSYLLKKLHFSSATVNRDLNLLQKRGLIQRSYGGVELVKDRSVPLEFRMHKQHHAKECIARKAAEMVQDGDIVFIDGSTTAQYMGPYLTDKERITVISNNLMLLSYLSDRGVECICLGGRILEAPSMTGSIDTVDMARTYRADKAFFSTGAVTDDGAVFCGGGYYDLHRVMIANSKEAVYLIDSEKLAHQPTKQLCDFGGVSAVISDHDFSHLRDTFPNTQLITVEL
ncbi:MAG: DeoR/GlpR transcriptional regulator [Clostridia bacterium]|nr:DeoR/GlpR transcriptional regulator [Clostridia bacterium]